MNLIRTNPIPSQSDMQSYIFLMQIHCGNNRTKCGLILFYAEREGFEPSVPVKVHTLSRRAS